MKIIGAALLLSLLLIVLAPPAPTPANGQPLTVSCPRTVTISATADTQLVATSLNKFIAICAFVLVAAAAEVVSLIEGIGTTCANEQEALIGSLTAANGMSLAINGTLSIVSPTPFIRSRYDDKNLCLTKDGADRVTGFLSYVFI